MVVVMKEVIFTVDKASLLFRFLPEKNKAKKTHSIKSFFNLFVRLLMRKRSACQLRRQ